MNPSTCLFTIVSRNYLHFACTLMESVAEYAPWMERVVCLCDSAEEIDPQDYNFRLMTLRDLPIPEIDAFIFQYTILELNTAIKPFVFEYLAQCEHYQQIFYFDPDIRVYSSLQPMSDILQNCQILLTPHLSDWLDDGKHPKELSILQSGSYNLGYIGVRNTPEALKLMTWWQSKMLRECVVDIPRGLFVDQKWMDMVPGMYDGVHIERHPGWNTAYWNINHRTVLHEQNGYTVNAQPLVFFHFSGVSLDGKTFSKHQDRYTLQNLTPAVRELMEDYVEALRRHEGARYSKIPYAFAKFRDDTPIPDSARMIFREQRDYLSFNLAQTEGEQAFIEYLNQPAVEIGRSHPLITRLAYKLYQQRSDLKLAFPDVLGVDALRYANWFVSNATEQAKIAERFVEPIRHRMQEQTVNSISNDGIAMALPTSAATPSPTLLPRLNAALWRNLYRVAWRGRGLVRHFVGYNIRHKLHAWLLRSAFEIKIPPAPVATSPHPVRPEDHHGGLNVVGYLFAESGIGQSARCTLTATQAANVEIAALDFRVGNVSRMNAEIKVSLAERPRFAVNLLHINADQIPLAYEQLGSEFFRGRYNIGYWAWELPEFPETWAQAAQPLNEVWVPSFFCQEAISAKIDRPVLRMPHCIDVQPLSRFRRADLGLPEQGFLFGFMFDVLSVAERKNPLAILDSFRRAFGRNRQDVRLVLKLMNTDHNPEFTRVLQERIDGDNSVVVLETYFNREQINGLLQNLDCYVSLHRSEGFGLTLAESMLLGKPVIATGWSGNMDFMTPWNSLPVRYELVELQQDYGPYKHGCHWAEPSSEHAAECMQALFNDPQLCARIGTEARRTIELDFSPSTVGERIRARLARLESGY